MVDDTQITNVETQDVKSEDIVKAKKKGSFFGDPILVIE
jgi:hypothetical protein